MIVIVVFVFGETTIFVALKWPDVPNPFIIKLLLENEDINLDFRDNYGMTPLAYSHCKGLTEII